MKVLYLSKSRRRIWRPEGIQSQLREVRIRKKKVCGLLTNEFTDAYLTDSMGDPSHGPGEVFALTPRTKLMTITYEYRLVYILDLSSSLATVGSTTPTILLSGAFER